MVNCIDSVQLAFSNAAFPLRKDDRYSMRYTLAIAAIMPAPDRLWLRRTATVSIGRQLMQTQRTLFASAMVVSDMQGKTTCGLKNSG